MGVSNLGDLVATATLDISPFVGNVRHLKMYARGLDNSLKTVEKSFKGQKDKLAGMKTVYTQTGNTLKNYQQLLDEQTKIYNRLKDGIGDVSNATKSEKNDLLAAQSAMMSTAATVADLENKYKKLGQEISIKSNVFTQMGEPLYNFGKKTEKFGQNVAGVGKAWTIGVTAPILAGVGYVAKAAIEYESAFAGVKKTVDETATTSYDTLFENFRKMSKELPASAAEIANVAEVAGQLGISADDVADFTKVMIDLGESTNLSATDAATTLAKFANITKLAPENYKRLGSAIVELGNNYATTEADISAMALRLAGAGAQIGLSQADIIGLSAALSSVGIEAEMGGSAFSKVMVNMQLATTLGLQGMEELTNQTGYSRRELELMASNNSKNFKKVADSIGMTTKEMQKIMDSSKKLENFGKIAGMTGEEFKRAFETDAVGAIGKFVEGLGTAEEKGESAIEMLNEMGFNEVRLRDTLLRAGNATDLFGKAVSDSNKAWNDNKALTEEANKRYETTESQLKMLKNEVTDVAIEFGQPFVKALREGLGVIKPWIKKAAEMAEAFSKMDKEQQQQIINWGMLAAAIGPGLSIFGKGIGIIGSTAKGLGAASKGIGKLLGIAKFLPSAGAGLTEFAGGATSATAAAGEFSGALGLLANPTTWGVLLGGAAVATVSYFAAEAIGAKVRAEEWGTAVSAVEANELSRFKDKVDETTQAMTLFGSNGKNDVTKVKEAVKDLVDEIEKLADDKLSKNLDLADKMGMSDTVKNALKKKAQDVKDYANRVADEMIAIYQRHNNEYSNLTDEELQRVQKYQTDLVNEQLKLMGNSGDKKIALQKAINGQLNELNATQLNEALYTINNWMNEEDKRYESEKKNLEKMLAAAGEDEAARKEINKRIEDNESAHQATMDTYKSKYLDALRARYEEERKLHDGDSAYLETLEHTYQTHLESMGISWEEFTSKSSDGAKEVSKNYELLGQVVEGMTQDAVDANAKWKSLVWDEKNAKIKTNAKEQVKEAAKSEEGWNNLEFILKNAEINSNARQMIVDAGEATGKWNGLTFNEKQMIVSGNQAMIEMATSTELMNQWNALTPEQKRLLVADMTAAPTISAQTAINNVKQENPVKISASNNTQMGATEATLTLERIKDKTVTVDATDNATPKLDGILGTLRSLTSSAWTVAVGAVGKGLATGTNFHTGGLAVVNDQKGPTYRELVTLPNGRSFIPEGRDVVLPLPRGSKVLKASKTKQLFPHYAGGIGWEDTKISQLTQRMSRLSSDSYGTGSDSDLQETLEELKAFLKASGSDLGMSKVLRLIEQMLARPMNLVLDDGVLAGRIERRIVRSNW